MSETRPNPSLVLDTHVVLDWQVFNDPGVSLLRQHLETARVTWVVCQPMFEEWQQVWPRAQFAPWLTTPEKRHAVAHHAFDLAHWVEPPPRCPWRCQDPDDQVFIDLAIAHRAQWLLTQDRALLRMARRASSCGVAIMTPAHWERSVRHPTQTA